MADRTRHNDRTTPSSDWTWDCGCPFEGPHNADCWFNDHDDDPSTTRDRLEPPTHLALAGRGPHPPFPDYPWGTQDPFGRLPQVGRAAMEQAQAGRVQAGAQPIGDPPYLISVRTRAYLSRVRERLHGSGGGS